MIPRISRPLFGGFARYARGYVRRNFHSVRVSLDGRPAVADEAPLVVYLNHPSWWDPLIGLILARTFWPGRSHYVPMEAAALERYRFMARLGCFGIEKEGRRGASAFLKTSVAILERPNTALWITGAGEFTDPRLRPVSLRPGLAHLFRRARTAAFVPLALEYPFWQERFPEALCRFGPPLVRDEHGPETLENLTHRLEVSLQATQDQLAAESIRRCPEDFEWLLGGSAGVGLIYDSWRRLHATVRGRRFDPRHGAQS